MKFELDFTKMIDRQLVQELYQIILNEVSSIRPLNTWAVQPTGVEFTKHKAKFGLATPEGKVLISENFLGTDAIEKLKNTYRHEFAHLSCGLENNHNKTFRRVEYLFGVTDEGNAEAEIAKVTNTINYKYTVNAHLANGSIVNYGGVHRKTKTYSEYDKKKTPMRDRASGVLIDRFEFIVN